MVVVGSWEVKGPGYGVGGPFLKLDFGPQLRLVLRSTREPRLRRLGFVPRQALVWGEDRVEVESPRLCNNRSEEDNDAESSVCRDRSGEDVSPGCSVGGRSERRLQPFTISRGRRGLNELFERLQFLSCPARDLVCTVEATGSYWHELVWGLRERGCTVYLAHPKKAHDLRRFYDLHTKTDITDAEALARMPLVDDRLLPVWIPSEEQQTLLRLCRLRWKNRCRIADVKRRVSYLADTAMPGLGTVMPLRYSKSGVGEIRRRET